MKSPDTNNPIAPRAQEPQPGRADAIEPRLLAPTEAPSTFESIGDVAARIVAGLQALLEAGRPLP